MPPSSESHLADLAQRVVALGRPALIAVDGVDGSGKTTFAARFAEAIEAAGRPCLVVHADDFLAPRAVRYRLGRDSPEGFFLDSYDLAALVRDVLDPVRAGSERRIRRRAFDHHTDSPVEAPAEAVPHDAVVLVEGLFLHRDELADRWDWSVFLDVPFAESVGRLPRRDGSPPDPDHPAVRRYVEGQRIYFARCSPHERATVVLDNTEPLPAQGSTPAEEVLAVVAWLRDRSAIHQVNGGWAVDALGGSQTRDHRDLDVFVDALVVDALLVWLASRGYRVVEDWRPVRVELTGPRGTVDVHPMVIGPDGDGVQQGLGGETYIHAAAERTTGFIAGHPVPVATARRLVELREGYPPRPVDHHDLALLRQILDGPG